MAVAKEYKIPVRTLKRWLKKHRETGTIQRVLGSGRKKSWNSRTARHAAHLICTGACDNAMDIVRVWAKTPLECYSVATIRNMLRSQGLHGRVRQYKPFLTRRHMKSRLAFAKKYRSKSKEWWRRTMFSDETRIKCFGSDGRIWCWRMINELPTSRTTHPTVKNNKGDFMIWACFSYASVGFATKISGTMDRHLYLAILKDELERSFQYCVPSYDRSDVYFMQDGASCHTAWLIQDYFAEQDYNILEWPSQSPDLNPIENLWAIMKRKLNSNRIYRRADDLWDRFQDVWEAMDPEILKSLIDSMPRRLEAVIKARGGSTKY